MKIYKKKNQINKTLKSKFIYEDCFVYNESRFTGMRIVAVFRKLLSRHHHTHTHTALIPCGYFFLANEFAAAAAELLATVPGKKEVTVGK